MDTIVTVDNGKYRFIVKPDTGEVICQRFGTPWVTFHAGSKALIALIHHAADLEACMGGKDSK